MNNQQGSTLGEKSKTYTATFNLTGNYKRFKVTFGMNGSVTDTDGEPSDLNINDYAYNTSRAVPVYDADGNYWSYLRSTSASATSTGDSYPFNILEDMENSYRKQKNNSVTARAGVDYDITSTLKITSLLSYSVSNNYTGNYHGQNTLVRADAPQTLQRCDRRSVLREYAAARRRRAERDPDRPPRLFGACGARLHREVRQGRAAQDRRFAGY